MLFSAIGCRFSKASPTAPIAAADAPVTPELADEEMEVTQERGSWEGSDVTEAEITWLRRSRRIPDGVECRRPGSELSPDLRPGEYVVFVSHFARGFGLPASNFFRAFLDLFHIQPHHLPANAIITLSCFATFWHVSGAGIGGGAPFPIPTR